MINTILWLITNSLVSLGSGVSYVLVSFLIWEEGKSLEQVLLFNLYIFFALIISGQIAGFISTFISPKLTFLLNLILLGLTPIILLDNRENVSMVLPYVSIMIGTYYGLSYNAGSIMTMAVVEQDKLVKLRSLIEIIKSVFTVISPVLVNYSINTIGYNKALKYLGYYFLVMGIIFLFIKVRKTKQRFIAFEIMKGVFELNALRSIAIIHIALGIVWAFGWGLMNIIILEELGSLDEWTIVSVITAVLGITLAMMFRKTDVANRPKARSMISMSSLVYAVIPLVLLFNFTRELFILFILAQLVFDKTNSIVTTSFINKMESDDMDYDEKKVAYQMFTDFFTGIGRIIPVVVFLVLPANLLSIKLILFTLAFASFLPYFFSKRLWFKYKTFGTG